MTTSAILDQTRCWIEVVGEHPDDLTDAYAIGRLLGWPDSTVDLRRVVWLPGGGAVADRVTIDDDGIATVVE